MAAEARVPAARAADTRGKEEKGGGRVSREGLLAAYVLRVDPGRARGCVLSDMGDEEEERPTMKQEH